MKFKKTIQTVISSTALLMCLSGEAQATIWHIDSVDMGVDGGFGFSGFHYSGNAGTGSNNDGSVMSGSAISNSEITSFMNGGTYDDSTGAFELTLVLDGGNNSVDLTGTFDFTDNSTLLAEFSSALSLPTVETLGSTVEIGFMPGDICCGGLYDPNGFYDLMDGTAAMSLWGATFSDNTFTGAYGDSLLGMDLRLWFTDTINGSGDSADNNSVPEPSSLVLMGLAFMAFGSSRSLRKA